jgi:hypothetical protein
MSATSFLYIVIYVLVIALIAWLATYALREFGAPPEIQKVGRIVIVVIAVICIILLLLNFLGGGPIVLTP